MPSSIDPTRQSGGMGLGQISMSQPQMPQTPQAPSIQGPMYAPPTPNIPQAPVSGSPYPQVGGGPLAGYGQGIANLGTGMREAATLKYQMREREKEKNLAIQGESLNAFLQGWEGLRTNQLQSSEAFRQTVNQGLMDGTLTPENAAQMWLQDIQSGAAEESEAIARLSKFTSGLPKELRTVAEPAIQAAYPSEYGKAQAYFSPEEAQGVVDKHPWLSDPESIKKVLQSTPISKAKGVNTSLMMASNMQAKLRLVKDQNDLEILDQQLLKGVTLTKKKADSWREHAKTLMGVFTKTNPNDIRWDPKGINTLDPKSELMINDQIANSIAEPFADAIVAGGTPNQIMQNFFTAYARPLDSVEGQAGGYPPTEMGRLITEVFMEPYDQFSARSPQGGDPEKRLSPGDALGLGTLFAKMEPLLNAAILNSGLDPNQQAGLQATVAYMGARANTLREWGNVDTVLDRMLTPLAQAFVSDPDPAVRSRMIQDTLQQMAENDPPFIIALAAGQGQRFPMLDEWTNMGIPKQPLWQIPQMPPRPAQPIQPGAAQPYTPPGQQTIGQAMGQPGQAQRPQSPQPQPQRPTPPGGQSPPQRIQRDENWAPRQEGYDTEMGQSYPLAARLLADPGQATGLSEAIPAARSLGSDLLDSVTQIDDAPSDLLQALLFGDQAGESPGRYGNGRYPRGPMLTEQDLRGLSGQERELLLSGRNPNNYDESGSPWIANDSELQLLDLIDSYLSGDEDSQGSTLIPEDQTDLLIELLQNWRNQNG